MLVKAWDAFMNMEEDAMDDVTERYMMSGTCPTGGPKNILRYAWTIAEDDVRVLTDEGGGKAKAVDSRGDVRVQVQVDGGGAALVQVPVDAGGGAGKDQVHVPFVQRAHVADDVDEGGSADPVLEDEDDDVTKVVADGGAVVSRSLREKL